MIHDIHAQARRWIALGRAGDPAEEQRSSLETHLDECESCQAYAEATERLIRSVRSVPMAAGPSLVRSTQARVRERARQLREERERLWLVGVSCFAVGISAAITTPLLWRAFQWAGNWTGVAQPIWEVAFAVFAVAPAIVTSALLLGRGIHMGYGGRPGE